MGTRDGGHPLLDQPEAFSGSDPGSRIPGAIRPSLRSPPPVSLHCVVRLPRSRLSDDKVRELIHLNFGVRAGTASLNRLARLWRPDDGVAVLQICTLVDRGLSEFTRVAKVG